MKACLFRRWLSFQTANWPFFSGRRPQNATPTTEWLRRLLADRVVWRTRVFALDWVICLFSPIASVTILGRGDLASLSAAKATPRDSLFSLVVIV